MDKKAINPQQLPAPRVEIINLIDVLITLIAFFLLTTVFAEYRDHLNIDLPQVEQGSLNNQSLKGVVIELDKENNLYLTSREQAITEGELISLLQKETEDNFTVTIRADKDCSYEKVIHLLDLVQGCGIKRAALEVRRERDQSRESQAP